MLPQTIQEPVFDIGYNKHVTARKPKSAEDAAKALLIGSRIKLLREQKQYTQLQLALIVKITSGAIGQYETGRTFPKIKILERLAAEFGVTTEWLMTGEDPEETIKAQTTSEREALRLLRSIPTASHDAALAMLRGLSAPAKKK